MIKLAEDFKNRPAWVVIVNPVSADSRTGRDWPKNKQLLRRLLPPFTVRTTSGPNQATELAYQAVEQGYTTVVGAWGRRYGQRGRQRAA